MTKIAISPNVSGTGTFTIAAPNSNTNRTLTLPDAGGVVATQEYIPTALNATGSAPIYACRAWVNFNGTGTVAIRASGNVSSITDLGTGQYQVNFTTALPDTNYAVTGITSYVGDVTRGPAGVNITALGDVLTSSCKILTLIGSTSGSNGLLWDLNSVYVAFVR